MHTSLELNPNADEPLLYLGMIASKKSQFKQAINYFNLYLEHKPDSFIGHTLIARTLAKCLNAEECKVVNGPELFDKFVGETERKIRELFQKAEEDINFCLDHKPKNINSLLYKGIILLNTNNAREALAYFNEVLLSEKNNVMAIENRAFCKSALGQNALADFNSLCSLVPTNGHYFYNRAIYLINSKLKGDYCSDLKKAISLGVDEAKKILLTNCK